MTPLKIDFVSDIACPWCAVGLGGLEQALERVANQPEVKAAMLKAGAEPAWANAQGLASFMQTDSAQWKKVAAFAKITLD